MSTTSMGVGGSRDGLREALRSTRTGRVALQPGTDLEAAGRTPRRRGRSRIVTHWVRRSAGAAGDRVEPVARCDEVRESIEWFEKAHKADLRNT